MRCQREVEVVRTVLLRPNDAEQATEGKGSSISLHVGDRYRPIQQSNCLVQLWIADLRWYPGLHKTRAIERASAWYSVRAGLVAVLLTTATRKVDPNPPPRVDAAGPVTHLVHCVPGSGGVSRRGSPAARHVMSSNSRSREVEKAEALGISHIDTAAMVAVAQQTAPYST